MAIKSEFITMQSQTRHSILSLAAFCLVAACGCLIALAADGTKTKEHVEQQSKYPETLIRAVAEFNTAIPEELFEAAGKVCQALPRCPVIWTKDIGTGVIEAYDYSKPSYILSTNDVIKLLGKPSKIDVKNPNNPRYYYTRKAYNPRTFAEPRNVVSLAIEFQTNRVVLSIATLSRDLE